MDKPPSKAVALLVEALTLCAKNKDFIRRVENGGVHEDMVLSSLCARAEKAGLSVKMVELHSSTHPLSLREEKQQKPADYRYHVDKFLEIDDRFLRLSLKFRGAGKRETLQVVNLPKEKAMSLGAHGKHQDCFTSQDPMEDAAGMEILDDVLNGRGFDAALLATKLDTQTVPAKPSRASLRL